MNPSSSAIIAAALFLLVPMPALAAFQCPAADVKHVGDIPKLSAEDMRDADGPISEKLKTAIQHLRADGSTSGEIVDHMVVAYCGRVESDSTLSDDEKAKHVSRFASKLVDYLYGAPGSHEEAIIVDVSVPTLVFQRLQEAAKKAGVSNDAWVNQAIASRLASPN